MNLSVEYLPRHIPQTELVSAIASGAINAMRTDSIYKAVKRQRVQFESGVRKLGGKATPAKIRSPERRKQWTWVGYVITAVL